MIIGVILAGGKGTRLGLKDKNKTTVLFHGKPLIFYALELYKQVTDTIVVVTGYQAESVSTYLQDSHALLAYQAKRLGTGHAAQIALARIEKEHLIPEYVFIGYGDHMMFYKKEALSGLLAKVKETKASVGIFSTEHADPSSLAWGRLIRGADGQIEKIVEQKNATDEEKKVTLINPGFYCVEFSFLQYSLKQLKKNPVSQEYYLTDIVEIARNKGEKVIDLQVPFSDVGIGINTTAELNTSEMLYTQRNT